MHARNGVLIGEKVEERFEAGTHPSADARVGGFHFFVAGMVGNRLIEHAGCTELKIKLCFSIENEEFSTGIGNIVFTLGLSLGVLSFI
jgi:hypothetical protein